MYDNNISVQEISDYYADMAEMLAKPISPPRKRWKKWQDITEKKIKKIKKGA